jgi:hypothetical protein
MSIPNCNVGALLRGRRNGWDVVSVSPPTAYIKNAGKRPATVINGRWVELRRWETRKFTDAELDTADKDGAGAGIRFRSGRYVAFDIDITDVEIATKVRDMFAQFDNRAFLGTIYRVGQAPKFALLFLATVSYVRGQIGLVWDRNGTVHDNVLRQRVDLFTGAGQIVVDGIHPKTGEPFRCYVFDESPPETWRSIDILDRKPIEVLKPVTPNQIEEVINSIVDIMRVAGWGEPKVSLGHMRPWSKRLLHKRVRGMLNGVWRVLTQGRLSPPARIQKVGSQPQRVARLEDLGLRITGRKTPI